MRLVAVVSSMLLCSCVTAETQPIGQAWPSAGTERLPMDSFATEVIARTADGKLWKIVFDVMVDGEAAQQWNQICQSVAVDPRTMIIDASACIEKTTGRLVSQ